MEGVIYRYTNKLNGKVYIGQTINEAKRKSRHKSCKDQDYFHNAIKKYGWENFDYEVVERVDSKLLDERETFWIVECRSNEREYGYNLSLGGEGGGKRNPEVGLKISQTMKGKHMSPDTEFKKGHIMSEETRLKISESLKGNKRTLGKDPWNKGKKTGIVTKGTTGMHWTLVDGKRIYTKS